VKQATSRSAELWRRQRVSFFTDCKIVAVSFASDAASGSARGHRVFRHVYWLDHIHNCEPGSAVERSAVRLILTLTKSCCSG
jgi:hypothetical protein